MSDWYRNRLSQARQERAPSSAPVARQFPAREAYTPQYQGQHQQVTQAPPQPQVPQDYDSTSKQGQASLSDLLTLQQVTGRAKGGIAARTNPHPCPSCGSHNFVTTWPGIHRGPQPAPRCFECGYNELFTQGEQSAWMA